MPVTNIEVVSEIPPIVRVKFIGKDGEREYEYVGGEALAIMAGANPSQFKGTRIDAGAPASARARGAAKSAVVRVATEIVKDLL